MSGGAFEYQQYRLNDIASQIEEIISHNDDTEPDEYGQEPYHYKPEVIEKFKDAVFHLKRCENMVQRIDWLVSGDDGEEGFLKRWAHDVVPC